MRFFNTDLGAETSRAPPKDLLVLCAQRPFRNFGLPSWGRPLMQKRTHNASFSPYKDACSHWVLHTIQISTSLVMAQSCDTYAPALGELL